MTTDDLKRIFLGNTLFRLDTLISPRIVPVLYAAGLGAILLWAVDHLFGTFALNFGAGLWGLLEIVIYGSLAVLLLRVLCELLLIYFKQNEETAELISRARISSTLLEEVRDAIHDIADEEDDLITPATVPAPDASAISPRAPRRTPRRAPKL